MQFITSLPLFNLLFLQTVENRVVRNLERRKTKTKTGKTQSLLINISNLVLRCFLHFEGKKN